MKRKILLVLISFVLIAVSCDEEDLLLINIVNPNGSILRKIVMTWDKPDFDLADSKVPINDTWTIKRDSSISESKDTIYTLEASRLFASVEEINNDYQEYNGPNGDMKRWAEFEKHFRWFTTTYRYSENIGKAMEGYAPEEYLDSELLRLFYMPEKIALDFLSGSDNTAFQEKYDTMEVLTEEWLGRSLVKAAFIEIESLIDDFPDSDIDPEFLWENEVMLGDIIFEMDWEKAVDSIMGMGFMKNNKVLFDSAMVIMEEKFEVAFNSEDYLIQTQMPGKLLLTNGYIDTDGNIVWQVEGDYFLAKDYLMWAESARTNWWAWIVTAVVLLFIIVGLIKKKK